MVRMNIISAKAGALRITPFRFLTDGGIRYGHAILTAQMFRGISTDRMVCRPPAQCIRTALRNRHHGSSRMEYVWKCRNWWMFLMKSIHTSGA